jgi:hypothetical protein
MRKGIESFGCLFIVDPADRGTLKRLFFFLGWSRSLLGGESEKG